VTLRVRLKNEVLAVAPASPIPGRGNQNIWEWIANVEPSSASPLGNRSLAGVAEFYSIHHQTNA